MIYLDSSVVLARVFIEDPLSTRRVLVATPRIEPAAPLRGDEPGPFPRPADPSGRGRPSILDRVALIDLAATVLDRALAPFPVPVRTLDSLHLATIDYLSRNGQTLQLATYDLRLAAAATALGFPLAAL